MKKTWMTLLILLLIASLPASALAQARKLPDKVRQMRPGAKEHPMIEAERAFSTQSAEKGIQEAFLTYLADDAVIFRPGPVSGRQWFSEQGELNGSLTWAPTYVEIAGSGELGFSTGTYEFTAPAKDEKPGRTRYGHFVSVWEKKVIGWRVILDHGISHSAPESSDTTDLRSISPKKTHEWEESIDALVGVDKKFGELSSKDGFLEMYKKGSEEDLRIYREGHLPLDGRAKAVAGFAELPIASDGTLEGAGISRSKDLAFTYGKCTITDLKMEKRGPGSYVRVWRRDAAKNEWKLILDMATPHPKQPEGSDAS